MYGGRVLHAPASQAGQEEFKFARQALHAYEITFVHPVTLNTMTLQAPVPADMLRLLKLFRG
jgi:23S rRNA pseudouridine1911/1915/1917 synthase